MTTHTQAGALLHGTLTFESAASSLGDRSIASRWPWPNLSLESCTVLLSRSLSETLLMMLVDFNFDARGKRVHACEGESVAVSRFPSSERSQERTSSVVLCCVEFADTYTRRGALRAHVWLV